ncbi:ATP synthase F0 subunit B [Mycoplasma sp. SG1]|uniref:ATP synthase F0 subunit B n=1 Tax=Mycoplasma sp. SG1 TaxID=2810348 RepID=UPI002023D1CE|nr:hypothetical protein [Mycoplasma sp. SG1]URM52970.1 hypothetical protein JRW51_01330 [Mycoplasma sp. SG1]
MGNFFSFNFYDRTPDIKGDLFPNISTLIAHLIALFVLLFIIYRFAWKPFKKFVKARHDYIQDNIKSSEQKLFLSLENVQKSKENLDKTSIQADQIIESSKLEAYKVKELIINKAKKEIEIERENFKNEMEQVKNKFLKQQKDFIVDSAYQISKEFIKTNNSEEADKKFIAKLLAQKSEENLSQSKNTKKIDKQK